MTTRRSGSMSRDHPLGRPAAGEIGRPAHAVAIRTVGLDSLDAWIRRHVPGVVQYRNASAGAAFASIDSSICQSGHVLERHPQTLTETASDVSDARLCLSIGNLHYGSTA